MVSTRLDAAPVRRRAARLVAVALAPSSSRRAPRRAPSRTPRSSAERSGQRRAAGRQRQPSASAAADGPDCGTDPVVLIAYFETGFDLPFKLSEEFTKQFPNVTWDISRTSSRTS